MVSDAEYAQKIDAVIVVLLDFQRSAVEAAMGWKSSGFEGSFAEWAERVLKAAQP